ncbi:glycosyltransferase [Spirosoma sp. HMF4905]|uniref:Glycosyltransferase n=1 Tax=Spirosoma arboris TaxID=2682092 RepID=A0A7K1SG66_9BACT|nr:glycosyltransferase family 1 protein [Spirosoma arboris]MVM32807.1 glycosyltransferase [Spirosoma arboris]
MNIILDASPLGIGFYHRQARTGISRVIEQLISGMHRSPEVNLLLAAPTHIAETMRYAQSVFDDKAPTFANKPREQYLARLENHLLGYFSPDGKPTKVIRELTYRTRRAVGHDVSAFNVASLPKQTLYHATFFPIPETIRQSRALPMVQSIYDIIPILHPEWFTSGEQTVKQVLATLPPDAWVTTISQATKDDFCAYTGFDPNRVVPILLAASPTLFYPVTDHARQQTVKQKLGISDKPYLLSLATLEPRKNIAHLIRSFGQLVDERALPSDVQLVLVGTKGWKFDEIMAEASKSPALASRLVFTGFVPDEDLAPLYSGAMAFIYPSLYEGFGLPPLEAMQCGLPVITSTIPAISEVVGKAAIQVSPTNTDDLCQAIITLAKSPSIRAELSEKGLKQASLFGWDKFNAEHITLYKTILNGQ